MGSAYFLVLFCVRLLAESVRESSGRDERQHFLRHAQGRDPPASRPRRRQTASHRIVIIARRVLDLYTISWHSTTPTRTRTRTPTPTRPTRLYIFTSDMRDFLASVGVGVVECQLYCIPHKGAFTSRQQSLILSELNWK